VTGRRITPAWLLHRALRALSLLALLAVSAWPHTARATQPPEPGMLERMRTAGTLDAALARAAELGNFEPKLPNHGSQYRELAPQELADQIMSHLGWSLKPQSKAGNKITSSALSPAELDLNADQLVDERDILALGFPRPKVQASLPSLGAVNVLCLYIDFPDYPLWFGTDELDYRWFGEGDTNIEYRSLHWFYDQSSYGGLSVNGTLYHHQASHARSYYHPDDNNNYGYEETRRMELLTEAVNALDQAGQDFTVFDNDGDGAVDYYAVVWTGPHGDWLSYWWPQCFPTYTLQIEPDGVSFVGATLSWQWEQRYGFSASPPNTPYYSPAMPIHETGHALGLPDLYDYDEDQGPDGGVGHMDMMDGNWGDHNCFTKYILDWLAPVVAYSNLNDQVLRKSENYADAVIFMPGFDPVTPWSEYFMAQYRSKDGVDVDLPASGMLLWHVDSSVTNQGGYAYNNSFTAHKLLRLMEADGLEQIEHPFNGMADAGDFYQTGSTLSPTSAPNSNRYGGGNSGITVNDFSAPGSQMTADFTLYSSNPPQVSITAPAAGSTVSGSAVAVTINATDDVVVNKVQLLIDGQVVKTWNSWTGSGTYNWNSLVEFNKTLALTARAWDGGQQSGSATISVTVSNSGVTSISDGFEGGLGLWRVVNTADKMKGAFTEWSMRTSPASPPPLGSGAEAYILPPADSQAYSCYELLRSQRINASGFTRPVRVRFYYRSWVDGQVVASVDNGTTWTTLANATSTSPWTAFDQCFSGLTGATVYLGFLYQGSAQSNYDSLCAFNIDNVAIEQTPSDPPTVDITAPLDGGKVGGQVLIVANANDDGAVAQVKFYINNALVSTDTSAPWQYVWNTVGADNHPSLPLKAIAVDNDGLPSSPDEIHVAVNNAGIYPVNENLETNANWTVLNYSPTPNWAWVSNKGHSGTHSYGWVLGIPGDGANYESVRYIGRADLAASSVIDPVLRLYYTGDLPSDARIDAFFVNSWTGSNLLFSFSADQAGWYEVINRLDDYIGYSGQLYFYVSNVSTAGTGVWIDDLRIENEAPLIQSISPRRGVVSTLLTIDGMSFGLTRAAGSNVTFGGGTTAADSDIVLWNNSQIKVKIPSGAVSGDTTVTVNALTSNGERVAVLLAPPNLQDLEPQ
jgi:M6 family metalloprotease-like protein